MRGTEGRGARGQHLGLRLPRARYSASGSARGPPVGLASPPARVTMPRDTIRARSASSARPGPARPRRGPVGGRARARRCGPAASATSAAARAGAGRRDVHQSVWEGAAAAAVVWSVRARARRERPSSGLHARFVSFVGSGSLSGPNGTARSFLGESSRSPHLPRQ